jgi:tRNA1(Val) A37 N6-methylase TrmN6
LKSSSIVIHSKVGLWFILERDYGGASVYTAVSSTSSIILTEEDLERAIFVGDQTMILKEEGDNNHEGYYSIYNTFGKELITEKPIIVYKEKGVYTDEIHEVYGY